MKLLPIFMAFFLVVIFLKTKCQEDDQPDNLKISNTSNGNAFIFGNFAGELIFNNGDILGANTNQNQGYFLALIDSSGLILWTKHIRTHAVIFYGAGSGVGLFTDTLDNVFLTATFTDSIIFDEDNYFYKANYATFIAKYNYSGNFLWAETSLGSAGSFGSEVFLDQDGNIFNTGTFGYGTTFTFDTLVPLNWTGQWEDIYLVKFDSSGNAQWLQQLYSNSFIQIYSLTTDLFGYTYLIGFYGGGGFSGNAYLHFGYLTLINGNGLDEIFIAKCSPDGEPVWLNRVLSISGSDVPEEIIAGDSANLYITGTFSYTSQFQPFPPIVANDVDVFIANYDDSGNAKWVKQASPNNTQTYYNISKGIDGYILF